MTTTFFRIVGDWLHTVALLLILHRLFVVKNGQGVSRKTQELCLLTSLFRYVDLFTMFYSPYNSLMKLFFIFSTAACVYIQTDFSRHAISKTYRPHEDSFSHLKLIFFPCLVIGLLTHLHGSAGSYFDFLEFLWTVSLYLEAAACIPQIVMFRKYRQVESLIGGGFILLFGIYRGCYVLNYIVRAHTEKGYQIHWALRLSSIAQFLVCTLGVFWPARKGEAEAAPLLPQLIQFYREICTAKTGAALAGTACFMLGGMFQGRESTHCVVCSGLLMAMTTLCTGFVAQMWRIGDLEKRRSKICAALSCVILWSVLFGASYGIIMFLVFACGLVCCAPEYMLTGQHPDESESEEATVAQEGEMDSILVV